jgi:TP901 family phage tail tape measure protein
VALTKVGTGYVDIIGNFAPLMKQAKSSTLRSRLAAVGKVGAVAVAAIGVAAVKSAAEFQHSMQQISTQAGASKSEVNKLSGAVLDLSRKSTFSPNDLANALFHIESAGQHGAKAMKTLNAAQKLATVGQSDLESTTYALVSAIETGIKGTGNLDKTIGTLNATVGHGDLRMEDLTSALSTGILPSAKAAGLSLHDVGAALDVMTARGVPAQQAATRLRMTFSLLGAQTDKAKAALETIGIKQGQLGEMMQHKGLVPSVQLLADHLKEAGDKAQQFQLINDAFGGGRTSSGILTLIQNVGDLKTRYDEVGKTAGDFNEKLKEARADPINQLHNALANVDAMLITLGTDAAPALAGALQDVTKVVTDPHMGFAEKITKLSDMIAGAVANAGPKVAEAAVKIGATATSGFIKGFIDADPLGKLAISAALIKLFAPAGTFRRMGASMGNTIGKAIPPAISKEVTSPAAVKSTSTAIQKSVGAKVAATTAAQTFGGRFTQTLQTSIGKARGAMSSYFAGVGNRMGGAMMIALGGQIAASVLPGGRISQDISDFSSSAALGFLIKRGWGALGGVAIQGFAEGISSAINGRDIAGESGVATGLRDFYSSLPIVGGPFAQLAGGDSADIFKKQFADQMKTGLAHGGTALTEVLGGEGLGQVDIKTAAAITRKAKFMAHDTWVAFHRATADENFGDVWQGMTPDEKKLGRQVNAAANVAARLAAKQGVVIPGNMFTVDPKTSEKLGRQLNAALVKLRSGVLVNMSDIKHVFSDALKTIDQLFPNHGKRWREATAQSMRAMAEAIGRGMKSGAIPETKANLQKVQQLIHDADLRDPSAHFAAGFGKSLAAGMKNGRNITKDGVSNVLKELGKMPDGARQIAVKTLLGQVKETAQGNKKLMGEYRDLRSNIFGTFDDIGLGSQKKAAFMAGGMANIWKSMVDVISGSGGMGTLGKNVNSALKAFGVSKNISFKIAKAAVGALAQPKTGKGQTGGFLVPGHGTGDTFETMLPHGSVVVNKKAAPMVPVALEPGELAVLPDAVQKIGPKKLLGINKMRKRFAGGGTVGGSGLDFALGPYTVPPITYDPDHAGANSHVHISAFSIPWLINIGHQLQQMGNSVGEFQTTSFGNPFHFGPVTTSSHAHYPTDHYSGHAVDVNSLSSPENKAWVASIARVLGGAGVGGAMAEKIARLILQGPDGPIKDTGQGALDKVRNAANSFLSKFAPMDPGVGSGTFPAEPGGWFRVGATAEGLDGQQGAYGTVGGMGFAELLLAGANAGMHPNLEDVLGTRIPPMGKVQFKMPNSNRAALAVKNDIGSGQAGDGHYLVDIQTGLANAIGWHPNEDVDVKKAMEGGLIGLKKGGKVHGGAGPPGGHGHGQGEGGSPGAGRHSHHGHPPIKLPDPFPAGKHAKKRIKKIQKHIGKLGKNLLLSDKTEKALKDGQFAIDLDDELAGRAESLTPDFTMGIFKDMTPGNATPYEVRDEDDKLIGAYATEKEAQAKWTELFTANLVAVRGKTEPGWLGSELAELGSYRNVVLGAGEEADHKRKKGEKLEKRVAAEVKKWQKYIKRIGGQEDDLKAKKRHLDSQLDDAKKAAGKIPKTKGGAVKKFMDQLASANDQFGRAKDNKDRKLATTRLRNIMDDLRGYGGPGAATLRDLARVYIAEADNSLRMGELGDEKGGLSKLLPKLKDQDGKIKGRISGLKQRYQDLVGKNGSTLVDIQGLDGPMGHKTVLPPYGFLGGEIFDVQQRLKDIQAELPKTEIKDYNAPAALDIAGLVDFANLVRAGAFRVDPFGTLPGGPPIPVAHAGGTYRAPIPGGEGPVLLADRETVLPAEGGSIEPLGSGSGGDVVLNGPLYLNGDKIGDIMDARLEVRDRKQHLQLKRNLRFPRS